MCWKKLVAVGRRLRQYRSCSARCNFNFVSTLSVTLKLSTCTVFVRSSSSIILGNEWSIDFISYYYFVSWFLLFASSRRIITTFCKRFGGFQQNIKAIIISRIAFSHTVSTLPRLDTEPRKQREEGSFSAERRQNDRIWMVCAEHRDTSPHNILSAH